MEASDGVEALKLANHESGVDLVISDINMPNMDGISLIKELRNLNDYKFTPILVDHRIEYRKENGRQGGWRHRLDCKAI